MLAAGDFLNQSHSYPERIRRRRKRRIAVPMRREVPRRRRARGGVVDGVVRRRLEVR
ncbi:hypothetical protein LINPERHAP1_LOCUS33719 [Linum perenne]